MERRKFLLGLLAGLAAAPAIVAAASRGEAASLPADTVPGAAPLAEPDLDVVKSDWTQVGVRRLRRIERRAARRDRRVARRERRVARRVRRRGGF